MVFSVTPLPDAIKELPVRPGDRFFRWRNDEELVAIGLKPLKGEEAIKDILAT